MFRDCAQSLVTTLSELRATARNVLKNTQHYKNGTSVDQVKPCLYVKNMQNDILIVKTRSDP